MIFNISVEFIHVNVRFVSIRIFMCELSNELNHCFDFVLSYCFPF